MVETKPIPGSEIAQSNTNTTLTKLKNKKKLIDEARMWERTKRAGLNCSSAPKPRYVYTTGDIVGQYK